MRLGDSCWVSLLLVHWKAIIYHVDSTYILNNRGPVGKKNLNEIYYYICLEGSNKNLLEFPKGLQNQEREKTKLSQYPSF